MSDAQELPIPKVLGRRALYAENALARCIKDNPPMKGFGRQLKVGDIVKVNSVCWDGEYTIGVHEET